MRDGVAILEIVRPIVRRADMFSDISGATSVETLAQDFTAAMSAPTSTPFCWRWIAPAASDRRERTGADDRSRARGETRVGVWEGLGASARIGWRVPPNAL